MKAPLWSRTVVGAITTLTLVRITSLRSARPASMGGGCWANNEAHIGSIIMLRITSVWHILVSGPSFQQIDDVRNEFRDRVQRFNSCLRRSRKVDDQRLSAHAGQSASERGKRSNLASFGAHHLAHARNFTLYNGSGSFRG